MAKRLIFFNTGWMVSYRGLSNDSITGGGKYVKDTGWGHEMFNFLPYKRMMFGYVQPKIDRKYGTPSTIKLEKIGGLSSEDAIENVTVVWTATDPAAGGTYIIGWYKGATVYRNQQDAPPRSSRVYKDDAFGFYATAVEADCHLLPVDERVVKVKRQAKNWMGQSNVWYADKNPHFVDQVWNYIHRGINPAVRNGSKSGGRDGGADPLKRLKVEKTAIVTVTKYYEGLGYKVTSVEKDNVGWDLIATNFKNQLKLEVKGLSGDVISTELTPNEYGNLKSDLTYYRICIVTSALTSPRLSVFTYSRELNIWTDPEGATLQFKEVISARVFV